MSQTMNFNSFAQEDFTLAFGKNKLTLRKISVSFSAE